MPAGSAPRDPNGPLGCIFPPVHPTDDHAREIVIDEDLGIVVDAAIVPGYSFPYPWYGKMVSAFIPSEMREPTIAQQQWFERKRTAPSTASSNRGRHARHASL